MYQPGEIKESFSTIVGLFEPKKVLSKIVNIIKNKEQFQKFGAHIPHGILLQGDTGNGKTVLSYVFAKETGLPFFVTSGSHFSNPNFVKQLFNMIRKHAPCITFN